ncbi:unnamed protein product [Schistosoma margrebowiei]|uniref:Uncharacterized protein n=1 Tax=Schistosoma margrebowiei TaxID=48269 RepID=A0A183MCL3_9TREM|nr:unnamed protein product [Schistosoma margrebowiei]
MVVGRSRQETLHTGFVQLGTRQQGVPVILRELVLPGGFDLNYLQPPPNFIILHAALNHLDWWLHCNMVDSIRSALIIRTRHA